MAIRNPVEWGVDQFRHAALAVESAGRVGRRTRDNLHSPPPAVRHIRIVDLRDVLARGLDDFAAYRTDVIFLCVIYPLVGLVLARLAFGYDLLPLLFPLASGFALAAGVYLVVSQGTRIWGIPMCSQPLSDATLSEMEEEWQRVKSSS